MNTNSFKDWLAAGEMLYSETLAECQNLESQLEQVEERLTVKRGELNRIGQLIGKPPVDPGRRLSAQLVDSVSASSPIVGAVTRALNGRGLGRG